jgi:flagellar hook protein FlgE
MIAGIQSALSGLQAFATKVENNANNVANVNSSGFKKYRVLLSEQMPQGVQSSVEQVNTPGAVVAEQTSQGTEMVELSNVDLGEELPDMMLNVHAYKANLKTLQAADTMLQGLLDVKA